MYLSLHVKGAFLHPDYYPFALRLSIKRSVFNA